MLRASLARGSVPCVQSAVRPVVASLRDRVKRSGAARPFVSSLRDRIKAHINNFDAGIKLPEGSLLDRAHRVVLTNVNQGALFNICQMCSLGASLSMEWTVVRCCLIASSFSWIVFHSSFPMPRPTRIAWSTLFCASHAYSLFLHQREEMPIALSDAERKLFEDSFEPHGFTRWHFRQLMAHATRRTVPGGEDLFEECAPIDRVTILLEGSFVYTWHHSLDLAMAERLRRKRDAPAAWARGPEHSTVPFEIARADERAAKGLYVVATLGARVPALHDTQFYQDAYARAELAHLTDERGARRWYASARATAPCEVIELPRDAVHALCERYPRMAAAASHVQIRLLQTHVGLLTRNSVHAVEDKDAEITTLALREAARTSPRVLRGESV